MADGAGGLGGGLGGTLFDAAKPLGQSLKSAGQQVVQQVTGQQVKPQGGTFTPPKQGGASAQQPLSGLDNFGDFAKLFEKNQLGGKNPAPAAAAQSQYMTQQQLQEMQSEQQAIDAQKIANLTQELHGMISKPVMNSGEEALKKQKEYMENLRKEDDEKQQADKEQREAQNANLSAPGQMKPGQMVDLGPVESSSSSSNAISSATRSGEAKHTE